MISRVSNLFELSLASLNHPVNSKAYHLTFEQRARAIRANPNPLKKCGALAVHNLVGVQPVLAARIQSGLQRRTTTEQPDTMTVEHYAELLRLRGIEELDEGAEAQVYRQNEKVLKAYKPTKTMTDPERENFRQQRELTERIMKDYLGNIVVDQTYKIGEHPVLESRVLLGEQAFVRFDKDDSLFPTPSSSVDLERLSQIEQRHPGIVSELGDYARTCVRMVREKGYLPDTHGANNLVVGQLGDSTELCLIDSHLDRSNNNHGIYHPHIMQQMRDLELAAIEFK